MSGDSDQVASSHSLVIDASGGSLAQNLGEAWSSRSLAGFLIWRDLKVRYKQSVIGAAWALVQPALMTAVFALVLGHLARVPSGDEPYWLTALSGLVPFTYFSTATLAASTSVVDNAALVSKVYFPRLLLPAAAAGSSAIDALLATFAFVGAAAFAGVAVWHAPIALLVPVWVWLVALSVSLGLAALNVRYRDVRVALPLALQIWMFVTPVVYPVELVPEGWRTFYSLNPMVGVVEVERAAVFGDGAVELVWPGLAVTAVLFAVGARSFQRAQRWFADEV